MTNSIEQQSRLTDVLHGVTDYLRVHHKTPITSSLELRHDLVPKLDKYERYFGATERLVVVQEFINARIKIDPLKAEK